MENTQPTQDPSLSGSTQSQNGTDDRAIVDVHSLLRAGAHFGHQTHRWNPKMLPYIFGERNKVHIINLDLTLQLWARARKYISDIASQGGSILFVGTKPNIRSVVEEQARRAGAFSVTTRWLGGTLSNFETIKRSIDRMQKFEELLRQAEAEGSDVRLNKKERLGISRELGKLAANLGGIREMKRHPDLMFVIDINKESIAIAEARKLHIPVAALVDTNTDPNTVDFPIPANDDSVRTVKLFASAVADAVIEGRQEYIARGQKEEQVPSSVKDSEDEASKREAEQSQQQETTAGAATVG